MGGSVYFGSWDVLRVRRQDDYGGTRVEAFTGITTAPTCNPPKAGPTSAATVANGVVYVGGGDAYWYALKAGTGRYCGACSPVTTVRRAANITGPVVANPGKAISRGHGRGILLASPTSAWLFGTAMRFSTRRTLDMTVRRRLGFAVAAALLLVSTMAATVRTATAAPAQDDWTTALHDPERTGASADTTIASGTASGLTKLWTVKTGGPVAATPTVVSGVAYFGSWDGYEYAVQTATGTVLWKTYLGVTTATQPCNPQAAGISSPASVQGGVVYVGGGDAYWYALNAATGAVMWRVLVGNPSGSGYDGHYNWSGPLLYNGFAYIGVASFGDCPLVQGQLLKVSLSTHTIVNTTNLVPNGQIGGGIWTMPALDPATNTIYFGTGTETTPTEQHAQALVAVDAGSMAITDHWKLPETEAVYDSDFGTSTTLFTDATGRQDLALINKNGYAYAFNRTSLSSGPIWQQSIAIGGDCPTCGQSSVSSGAFGGGTLLMAGGSGVINGVGYPGTVRALNPATGAYLWQHAAPGNVIGALAYDNGMVFDGGGSVLEVLDAQTGQRLYSYDTGSQIYAGPSIAEGMVFTGNTAGVVTAFGLPSSPTLLRLTRICPSGFTCQDIGSPTPAGTEQDSAGAWTVTAGGGGVAGTSDGFRLMSEPTNGDSQVTAEITPPPAGPDTQAGLMIRQSNDPGSPYYAVLGGTGGTLTVQYRTAFAGRPR